MKHVDNIRERGDIDYPEGAGRLANPDLTNPRTDFPEIPDFSANAEATADPALLLVPLTEFQKSFVLAAMRRRLGEVAVLAAAPSMPATVGDAIEYLRAVKRLNHLLEETCIRYAGSDAVITDGASLVSQWLPLSILAAYGLVSFVLALRWFRWT